MTAEGSARRIAYVGAYAADDAAGGVHAISVGDAGASLTRLQHLDAPEQAGYLAVHGPSRTLYAVDERKTDGRGPVQAPAAIHSFSIDASGGLTAIGVQPALGAFPTYLSVAEGQGLLFVVAHGGFDHVERVVADGEGGWRSEFVYDDSTVAAYELGDGGRISSVAGVHVLEGQGTDPNGSPQAGGHAQASPHAHCGVVDPSGRFLLVADKGTDRILTYEIGRALRPVAVHETSPETGPRHLAFHPSRSEVYVTFEFSSEVASFAFDALTGALAPLTTVSTLAEAPGRVNEPADIQIHPSGRVLYVNNRGEDALAWFTIDERGGMLRAGHVPLAASIHPGLAARSFAIDAGGEFALVADRPAGLLRSYRVDDTGALHPLGDIEVPGAAFVLIADPTSSAQLNGSI